MDSDLETGRQKVELLSAEESDLGSQNEETMSKISKVQALLGAAERKWGKVRNMKQVR